MQAIYKAQRALVRDEPDTAFQLIKIAFSERTFLPADALVNGAVTAAQLVDHDPAMIRDILAECLLRAGSELGSHEVAELTAVLSALLSRDLPDTDGEPTIESAFLNTSPFDSVDEYVKFIASMAGNDPCDPATVNAEYESLMYRLKEADHWWDGLRTIAHLSEHGVPVAAYERANLLRATPLAVSAIPWYAEAARLGLPHALGSLTWIHLTEGEIDQGARAYRELIAGVETGVMKAVESTSSDGLRKNLLFELANARSNGTLLELAAENLTPDAALPRLLAGGEHGHTESLVNAAILLARQGDTEGAYDLLRTVPPAELTASWQTNCRHSDGGERWFSEWCRTGMELLIPFVVLESE